MLLAKIFKEPYF